MKKESAHVHSPAAGARHRRRPPPVPARPDPPGAALAAGLVVAVLCAAAFSTVGTPPARAVAVSVAACFGLTVVWQRWRFARTRTRLVTGVALLVACYAAAVAVFLVSFDVAFLGAP